MSVAAATSLHATDLGLIASVEELCQLKAQDCVRVSYRGVEKQFMLLRQPALKTTRVELSMVLLEEPRGAAHKVEMSFSRDLVTTSPKEGLIRFWRVPSLVAHDLDIFADFVAAAARA